MLLNPQEISSPMSGVIDSSTFSTAETTPDIRKSPETGRVIQLQPIPLAAGAWHQQNSSIAGNQQCINIYISTYTITQATPLKRNVAGPGFDKDDTKIPSGWPPSASAVSSDAPHVEGSHLPSYWSCRSGGGGRMGGWDEWSSQPCFEG